MNPMAELWPTLLRFHREIIAPEIREVCPPRLAAIVDQLQLVEAWKLASSQRAEAIALLRASSRSQV